MIKEDVAYAKEQYKIAFAEYNRTQQRVFEIIRKCGVLEEMIQKLQDEIKEYKADVGLLKENCKSLKHDYEKKRKHWHELRTMRGMLANQNHNVKRNDND